MKKSVLALLAIALLAAGCGSTTTTTTTPPAAVNDTNLETTPTPAVTPPATSNTSPTPTPTPPTTTTQGQKVSVTVTGKNFAFTPSTIKVKKGDTVTLTFKNEGGTHDWVVDEFNARTKVIPGGQTDTVTFVADKSGTFEFYCSVGSHRAMGMKGSLVVE